MTEQEKIIKKLVAIREDQKLSQAELGRMSGVYQPVIARMEKLKHSPQLKNILRVLEPMGYTLDIVPRKKEEE